MATCSHTNTRERETDPYTHEHIIILSIHTCMSIIDTLHIHTHMTIDPLHTHIMSIDHLHTYEHIIHIHMNTSLHGQLTEMRDRSRERCKEEVRARPETFLYYLCNIQGKFYMLKMVNGWRN